MALSMMFNTFKELFKTFRAVEDGKLIQRIAIGQAYCHIVLTTTDINTDINLWGIIHDHGASV